MSKIPYRKPPLTYQKQLEKLKSRGMIVADEDGALFYLQHINYYRLGAYWLAFEEDHDAHKFKSGTRFEDVLELYTFDRELRLLVLDAIERIEVSVRAQWAYRMGHLHGAHAHLDKNLVHNKYHWQKHKEDLEKEIKRSEEIFIKHFGRKYKEPMPPVWAVCEVMSLGLLSRWYNNINPMHARSLISGVYKLDQSVFASWLHHLSIVRNICAHHSRLWDREFLIKPQAPKTKPVELAGQFTASNRLYNTLVIILYMMNIVSPGHHWRGRLLSLLHKYDAIDLSRMGFPAGWQERDIWAGGSE